MGWKVNKSFKSMTHLCACSGGSASTLGQTRKWEGRPSCKICGGKQLVDGRVALSGSMLSTVGLEISRVIDPDLNWKTLSKSNKRGARRARSSLAGGQKRTPVAAGSLKTSEDLIDKDSRRAEEMMVSESEKIGVTVRGRQFNDAVKGMPIKKRKFVLVRSPSPPPRMPVSESEKVGVTVLGRHFSDAVKGVPIKKRKFVLVSPQEEFDHLKKSQSALNLKESELIANAELQVSANDAGTLTELCQAGTKAVGEKINLEEINEDNDDFSGISILAAAACNGNVGRLGGASNVESVSILQNAEICSLPEESRQDNLLHDIESQDVKRDNLGSGATRIDHQKDLVIEVSNGKNGKKSLLENGTLRRVDSSSLRDHRSHWDLNIVMESWDRPCDDPVVEIQPGICEDDMHDVKVGNSASGQEQLELGDTDHAVESTVQQMVGIIVSSDEFKDCCRMQVEHEHACDGTIANVAPNGHRKSCISVWETTKTTEEEPQLDACTSADKITGVLDEAARTNSLHNESNIGLNAEVIAASVPVDHDSPLHGEEYISFDPEVVVAPIPVDCAQEPGGDSALAGAPGVVGKVSVQSVAYGIVEKKETMSSHLGTVVSEPHPRVYEEVREMDSSVAICSQSGNQLMTVTGAQIGEIISSGSQLEEDCVALPHTDLEKISCQRSDTLTTGRNVERVSALLVDGSISRRMMTTDSITCETAQPESSDDTSGNAVDQTEKVDQSSCHFDSLVKGSSSCEDSPMSVSCISENDNLVADMKVQDDNTSMVAEEKLDSTEIGLPVCIDSKDTLHDLASWTPDMVDTVSVMGQLSPCKSNVDSILDCALEDYESVVSLNDMDHSVRAGKVGELHDDDYQYEDGEFRESAVHNWGEDACEEGEAEHVDYESDIRDIGVTETAADYAASISLQVDSVEGKKETSLAIDHFPRKGDLVREKNDHETDCQPGQHGLLKADTSDIGSVEGGTIRILKVVKEHIGIKDSGEKLEMNVKAMPGCSADGNNEIENDEFGAKGDGAKESRKSTGWHRLSETCKSSDEAVDIVGDSSFARRCTDSRLDSSDARNSLRRLVGSTSGREFSSHIEGPRSSNVSFRMDRVYAQGSRSDDLDDSNPGVERCGGPGKSIGRVVVSPVPLRGRGDHWMGRHYSPVNFGPDEFGSPGSKNAAAAKVEISGFVVAPDGTILKGLSGRVGRRSANVSSQSGHRSMAGRGSPIDRDGALSFGMRSGLGPMRDMSPERSINVGRGRSDRYGDRVAVGTGPRERYNGTLPVDSVDSSFPMQHPLARREISFSPIPGRSLHVSRPRTQSRSRSRSRSPLMWTSPGRGRSGGVVIRGPGLRRYSRSPPTFRSEARMERVRSPHRRSGFSKHMVGFVTSSRSRGSPPRATRCIDDRKDAPDYFRENDYKRSFGSERSPPGRVFLRSQRFDLMDSPGILKPDEFYRPMHSGRFPESVGVGRGCRRDGHDDDRNKHGERYRIVHSISLRHYDMDGEAKRFRYEIEDGLRGYNSRSKNDLEFHSRGSPRDCEESIEGRLGASAPRRAREEKGHFRCAREGRHSAGYKTFAMQEYEVAPKTRRAS